MAQDSGEAKFFERAAEAVKKKNFDYAISNYQQILDRNPDNPEARKALLTCCRQRKLAGGVKASPADRLAALPLKKSLLAMGGLLLLSLLALSLLPNGEADPAAPGSGGLSVSWIVSGFLLALTAAFAALSPWPRLIWLRKRGRAADAVEKAGAFLQKNPDLIDLLEFQAEAANEAGCPEAALTLGEWILSSQPSHIPTLNLLGALYQHHRKDIPKSQQCYNRILKIDPSDLLASRAIKDLAAQATMNQGVESAATEDNYRKMLKDVKGSEKLESEQRVLKTADEIHSAIASKKEEIEKAPGEWRRWRDLGDLHSKAKAWDEAEEAYKKAIELEPVNPTLRMSLGTLTLRRFDERILPLKEALKASPADAEAKAKLAQAEKERAAFAVEEFGRRAKDHPTDATIRFEHGETLVRVGRVREAIAEYQVSVKDPKRKTASLLRLGECFKREGQIDLSVKQYEKALEDLGTMTDMKKSALLALGDAYEKQNRLNDAKKVFDELYEADINFRDVAKRVEALAARIKAGG